MFTLLNVEICKDLDNETKEKLKKKIEHKIERCNKRIEELNSKKNRLSEHGHWDLGYFTGRKSLLEDLLDELLQTNKE